MFIPGHSGRRTHEPPTPGTTRSTGESPASARRLLRDFPVGPITVSSGTSSHLKHVSLMASHLDAILLNNVSFLRFYPSAVGS